MRHYVNLNQDDIQNIISESFRVNKDNVKIEIDAKKNLSCTIECENTVKLDKIIHPEIQMIKI